MEVYFQRYLKNFKGFLTGNGKLKEEIQQIKNEEKVCEEKKLKLLTAKN